MACDSRLPLALAFPILAAAALVPDEADADTAAATNAGPYCGGYDPAPEPGLTAGAPDYCAYTESLDDLTPLDSSQIPIDGVLVLQAAYQGAWSPSVLSRADVVVTDTADGAAVEGTLELTDAPGFLIFRPAGEWIPGNTYHLAGTIINAGVDPSCAPATVDVSFDFAIGTDPLTELVPPNLSGVERVDQTLIINLESLACCPGVAPRLLIDMCLGTQTIDFDPAQCTSLEGNGLLTVDMTGTPADPGPAANQVYYTLAVDGAQQGTTPLSFSYVSDKPFCATLTAHSFATGEALAGPMACFGADSADVLGLHPIEPADSFTCSLRQCEVADNTWDLDACTPLDPNHPNEPEPSKGCDCNATAPPGLATLALAGLVLLRRRRRAR